MRSPALLVRDWRSIGLAVLATLCFGSASASAATLNVVGGQLHGAFGVDVDGSLYDVQFLDGTCIDLYNGCDEVSDFTFQTEASAILASLALLGQAFADETYINLHYYNPELTHGCDALNICHLLTVYAPPPVPPVPNRPEYRAVRIPHTSYPTYTGEPIFPPGYYRFSDYADVVTGGNYPDGTPDNIVHAVWTPVPEPNTALLLSLGLTGLAARRRSLRS